MFDNDSLNLEMEEAEEVEEEEEEEEDGLEWEWDDDETIQSVSSVDPSDDGGSANVRPCVLARRSRSPVDLNPPVLVNVHDEVHFRSVFGSHMHRLTPAIMQSL